MPFAAALPIGSPIAQLTKKSRIPPKIGMRFRIGLRTVLNAVPNIPIAPPSAAATAPPSTAPSATAVPASSAAPLPNVLSNVLPPGNFSIIPFRALPIVSGIDLKKDLMVSNIFMMPMISNPPPSPMVEVEDTVPASA